MKVYPITPIAKPRMTQRSTWKGKAFFKFCDDLAKLNFEMSIEGSGLIFVIPMPQSWTDEKKRLKIWTRHDQRPDVSNLLKAVEDAWERISGINDKEIWMLHLLTKVWGTHGRIVVVDYYEDFNAHRLGYVQRVAKWACSGQTSWPIK